MNNEQYVAYIKTLDVWGLLGEVLGDPSLLTDSYYRQFGSAIQARFDELVREKLEREKETER